MEFPIQKTETLQLQRQRSEIYVRPKANVTNLICRTEPQQKRLMKKIKNKNRDAQKKRNSHKAVESVLRAEGSLWWERFVKKVGLEPGVKERGSYGW